MGKTTRRKQAIIIVPDGYWLSSYDNIEWIYNESDAKTVKRNN